MRYRLLFLLLLSAGLLDFVFSQNFTDIPDSARQKIEKALPAHPQAEPLRKHKILVFNLNIRDGQERKGHPSIPFANYAIERMGETTGAYQVVFSNDTLMFTPENLAQFDAICFNNTVGVLVESEQLRNSLLDYIWQGGGFIGIHAAGATFVQYPVYDQFPPFGIMLGGYENGGHPWKPEDWITLKLDDPDHPVNSAFDKDGFYVSDEVFQFREHYSRDKLRVLLSIDTTRTDMSMDRYILPERRNDGDIAISWVRQYGRGHVFYTSLGHNAHLNWNPPVLQHYLDGIQFALGDLDAPITPSGKLIPAEKAREALHWQFAFSANTLKNQTLFDAINKTAELGLVYLDAAGTQQVSDDIRKPFDQNLTDNDIRAVRNKLEDAGVQLYSWSVPKLPGDQKSCKAVYEFAHKMGIRVLISEAEQKSLPMIEDLNLEYDIRLALGSGSPDSPYQDPKAALEIAKFPFIGVCGDVAQWVDAGIEPADAVRIIGKKLFVLHVHDLNKDNKDVPWIQGRANLDAMFRSMAANVKTPVIIGLDYDQEGGPSTMQLKQCVSWFDHFCPRLEVVK